MRLIDADALYASLEELYDRFGCEATEVHFSLADMEMNINGEETVDAVEVVRCKNCQHLYINDGGRRFCYMHGHDMSADEMDAYCSYGEVKEGEDGTLN